METVEIHSRPGAKFDLVHYNMTDPSFGDSHLKHHKHHGGERHDHKERRCQPVSPANPHEPAPCIMMSIFRCSRVSSSHFAARSLIARWISTSRIVSSTSSNGGTGWFFAFSCGTNSSL